MKLYGYLISVCTKCYNIYAEHAYVSYSFEIEFKWNLNGIASDENCNQIVPKNITLKVDLP